MIRNFVSALFHELGDQAPAALAALLDQWSEQRRHAAHAGMRQVPAEPPRVSLLLPRDDSRWPPDSWEHLLALNLAAPSFDGVLLRWDTTRRQNEIIRVHLPGSDAMRAQDPPSHLAAKVPAR